MTYTEAGVGPYTSEKLTDGPINYRGIAEGAYNKIQAARNSRALDILGISAEGVSATVLVGMAVSNTSPELNPYGLGLLAMISGGHALNRSMKHIHGLEYRYPFVDVEAK